MAASAYPALEDQIVCCTDKWAVRHRMTHEATGVTVPMLCGKYKCKYCGPRRVEMWRSVIELAEPERFITLTGVGKTLAEVGRVATTVVQHLRRRGYQFEYCLTFERHKNGKFHIHMLQKGDYIPQKVLSNYLRSATHGQSYVVDIRRCRPGTAGYVTKYATKLLQANEIGNKPDGTRARVNRVRYSKHFFPSPTKVLKEAFRAQKAEQAREQGEDAETYEGAWKLLEMVPLPRDRSGRVIEEAAHEQYRRLVAARVKEAAAEPMKLSKGGKQVLTFMVLESLRRGEFADGRVTYYLRTEYGYGDTMEVTPKDLLAFGAWLLEHEQVIVEDALHNDVLQAQQEIKPVVDGTMDYGSGRYKIVGGSDDGYQFHAGESLEVYYKGRWVPAVIETDDGRWRFLWPLDAAAPSDVYGLPVRRAAWGL